MAQYQVSARKYRPDSFDTLIGQDNIVRTLKNSVVRNQLAHAYLFSGPRGVGKTTAARIFARIINCSNPTAGMEPCGGCESCISFKEGRSYCIHELDAASNNGVDDMRTLIERVNIPPQIGKYSVYIVDEVHMLSQQAFNAFLKTLEEPPAHAIFILATTEKHKVIPTILSRCQSFDFNRINVPDIVLYLRDIASRESVNIDDESLHVIALKADGAMRDALTIFDQTVAFCGADVRYEDVLRNLNVMDYEHTFSLVDAFLAGNYQAALLKFDELLSRGFNALHFVSSLNTHFRNLLIAHSGGLDSLLELPASLKTRYKGQASRCQLKFIYDALGILAQCESGYKASVNPRLHVEFTLMRLSFLCPAPAAVAPVVTKPAVQTAAPVVQATAKPVEATSATVLPPKSSTVGSAASPVTRGRTVKAASLLSVSSMEKGEAKASGQAAAGKAVGAMPEEDKIRKAWPELAGLYTRRPRLMTVLSDAKLEFSESNGYKFVTFSVINEVQKKWIEEKLLGELESRLRGLAASDRIRLLVVTAETPDEEKKVVTPKDKAIKMMNDYKEVTGLVEDLGLQTKY